MARNPFDFLDSGSKERTLLLLLLALIKKQGGELELSVTDLTSVNDGDSFLKYPSDNGASLVLRFARRGAEAYFLAETESPRTQSRPIPRPASVAPTPVRHAIHSDLDQALMEEERAQKMEAARRDSLSQARAEAGVMPWRTVKPQ